MEEGYSSDSDRSEVPIHSGSRSSSLSLQYSASSFEDACSSESDPESGLRIELTCMSLRRVKKGATAL